MASELFDMFRGLYSKDSGKLRRYISPFLRLLPVSVRYGPTYQRTLRWIKSSEKHGDYIRNYQLAAMREILQLAFTRSNFYADRLQKAFGKYFNPSEFQIEDLGMLPVLTKEQVRENLENLLIKSKSQMDLVSTSGSSGVPLHFYLDKNRSPIEWAFVNHIWGRIGYQPHHRRVVLRGIHITGVDKKPWQFDPALNELRLSPFHLTPEVMDEYLRLIQEYHCNFIHGYPSAISILAAHAIRVGWKRPESLLGILPVSESLSLYQRDLFKSAFGDIPVMPFYGLSEKVAIAGEVIGQPDVYEFEPLYGLTELVDEHDKPIKATGEPGRIISTGLLFKGMPLIRYDTGDRGVLVQFPAPENGYRLRIANIHSRWSQEFLVAKNGALISIAAINIHSTAYAFIREFQFYQDKPGIAVCKIVPVDNHQESDYLPFIDEIQQKVGHNLIFSVELVEAISPNSRGKRNFVDQRLDIKQPVKLDIYGKS